MNSPKRYFYPIGEPRTCFSVAWPDPSIDRDHEVARLVIWKVIVTESGIDATPDGSLASVASLRREGTPWDDSAVIEWLHARGLYARKSLAIEEAVSRAMREISESSVKASGARADLAKLRAL